VCFVIIMVLVLIAIFANQAAPYGATTNNVGPALSGPSGHNLLGTDNYGRDLLSRVIIGARVSLFVGLGATLMSIIIATVLGSISGYMRGSIDFAMQRVIDAAQAVPPLIMLIGIMIVLGPSVTNVIIALAIRGGLTLARVIRGAVIGVRSLPYIEASRSIGASHARIIFAHIIPNIFPTIVVLFTIGIGANIVAEASLSFLGYGVPPPNPTWGGMMSGEGRVYMIVNPWILVAPTVALAIVVYAMNMFGDALRDEFDPRLRGSR
jgi:peptide/nickel transport system permease protein